MSEIKRGINISKLIHTLVALMGAVLLKKKRTFIQKRNGRWRTGPQLNLVDLCDYVRAQTVLNGRRQVATTQRQEALIARRLGGWQDKNN